MVMRKIKLNRGKLANLPQLELGEPAVATDDGSLHIGTEQGNVKLAKDADVQAVSQQLAEEGVKRIASNDFVRVGKINIQDDFPGFKKVLPFDLYRASDGIIHHTFDIEKWVEDISEQLYVSNIGNDVSGEGSVESPLRTINGAIAKARSNGWSKFAINMVDKIVDQNSIDPTNIIDLSTFLKVLIRPHQHEKVFFSKSLTTYSFAPDGVSFKTGVTAVLEVLDINNVDYRGVPQPLTKVSSKELCDATKNSWYSDGSSIWVNMIDGRQPDPSQDILIVRDIQGASYSLGSECELILKDQFIVQKGTGSRISDAIRVVGSGSSSRLINYNVSTSHGTLNGIATAKIGEVFSFDSTAVKAGSDGFNYHGHSPADAEPYEFAFEYNCHSYENGLSESGTNNATTAHDGMTILRVGSVGYSCHGPLLADVNSCDSLNYDCTMYDSKRPKGRTKAAYYVDAAASNRKGKAVFINCGGGGKDTFTINSDGNVEISVKNLKGNNIPDGLVLNTIS